MSDFDHLALDGHALQLFLAVLEEGSVTRAASRLGLTQSAVSHGLTRLRAIAGDPLFVKSGRGIVATAHARALADRAHQLLDAMKDFARSAPFDPAASRLSLTIAANDLQRDLLLPQVLARMAEAVERVSLRVVPSGLPTAEMLRENRCDLLITPRPPAGTDILQRRLFEDRYVCFYDPAMRGPPDRDAYLAADHATVLYAENEKLEFDRRLEARTVARDMVVSVPHFSSVPVFLRGTRMLATLPSLLARSTMAGFAQAPVPLPELLAEGVERLPMYLAWHRRNQLDPAQAWVRDIIIDVATQTVRTGAAIG
jgi:DNA-binding transcriptional LysR family regulator